MKKVRSVLWRIMQIVGDMVVSAVNLRSRWIRASRFDRFDDI